MRLPKRAGQCMLLLAVAVAGDAGALSRAMWAEFNAIYLMNLAPAAHCSTYRTRSLELLKNEALAPHELDAQMRALWKDARAACLQPLRSGRRSEAGATAGPAVTPSSAAGVEPLASAARAAAVKPVAAAVATHTSATAGQSPAPTDRQVDARATEPTPARPTGPSPPTAEPVAARDTLPQGPPPNATPGLAPSADATGAARVAASQHAPDAGPPQRSKPLIERPSVSELRLMAECERQGSGAGPTQTGDGRCAALGRGKEAVPAVGADAAPRAARVSWTVWTIALLGVLATSGAAAWWALRRRRSHAADPTAPASKPVEAHQAAGRPVAGDPAVVARTDHDTAADDSATGAPAAGQPVGKKQASDDALEFALPS